MARACLGIDSGVGDFRRDAGAWNMVVGFALGLLLARIFTRTINMIDGIILTNNKFNSY